MSLKSAILETTHSLTEDVLELNFTCVEPFDFKSGQYISVKITDSIGTPCIRAYSIASAPDPHKFTLCIKIIPGGRGSNWLKTLKKGQRIQFLGPLGHFTFQNKSKNAFFIATGAGIAPFKAIVAEELENNFSGHITLLFGVRHINDLLYQDFFENLAQKYPNFKYIITVSRPENEFWKGNQGRVTKILESMDIDTKNTDFYLCGIKDMVNEVLELLSQKGVKTENIYFEKYD